jgi:hypothetical protein
MATGRNFSMSGINSGHHYLPTYHYVKFYVSIIIVQFQRNFILVLQMENCSDGFNVPREHTAKLYIVGKRIMGSIGTFCSYEWEMVTFVQNWRHLNMGCINITIKIDHNRIICNIIVKIYPFCFRLVKDFCTERTYS